jgi:hypothetical protein
MKIEATHRLKDAVNFRYAKRHTHEISKQAPFAQHAMKPVNEGEQLRREITGAVNPGAI